MSTLCGNLWIVSLGQNIKRLRWEAGLQTQKSLADLLGVPQPQVSDWENDRYAVLETLTLIKIAKGAPLLGGPSARRDGPGLRPGAGAEPRERRGTRGCRSGGRDTGRVVGAGRDSSDRGGRCVPGGSRLVRPGQGTGDIVQWIARPGDLQDPNAYGVQIRGDSMLPAYRPTMIAIVSPGNRVQHGDEVYVQLASGERLVRVAHEVQGNFMLQSYNHAYTARFAKPKEIQAMHVIVYSRRRNC